MLSMIKEDLDPGKVLLIHDFLSGEACAALIQRSEGLLYEPGTVAGEIIEHVRNNERLLVDDVALASELFRRAEPFLPAIQGHKLVGFNEPRNGSPHVRSLQFLRSARPEGPLLGT